MKRTEITQLRVDGVMPNHKPREFWQQYILY